MDRLRLLRRDGRSRTPGEELQSLFVVSLPRSLSSLLYVEAARAVGLAEPDWTTDGEILNRDRVCGRRQSVAPTNERFMLLSSAPGAFTTLTSHLDHVALRRGCAYKDVVQPFVVGGWEGLSDFKVLKVRRHVADVAYTMLKRRWLYPAQAASVFDDQPWALVEGLLRADAVLDVLPGESVEYAEAVLDHGALEIALRSLYPDVPLGRLQYITRGFTRRRQRLEIERRDSLVLQRLKWVVSAVRERLRCDDSREEYADALP